MAPSASLFARRFLRLETDLSRVSLVLLVRHYLSLNHVLRSLLEPGTGEGEAIDADYFKTLPLFFVGVRESDSVGEQVITCHAMEMLMVGW